MSRLTEQKYDIIKGVSIYFVVCIHIVYRFFTPEWQPLAFELYNYLTGFAVPTFLILGGFFFGKKYFREGASLSGSDVKKGLINTLRRLVLPYYLFVSLLTCYNLIIGKDIFWKHFLFIDVREHGLYFLIIYTYASVFALSLLWLFKHRPKKSTSVLIAVSSLIFFVFPHHMRHIDSVVLSYLPLISFFCFGIPLYFLITHFETRIRSENTALALGIVLISYTALIYGARKILGPFPVITSAPPTVFELIYCLLAFWLALCLMSRDFFINTFKWVKAGSFGTNSLFIFLVHPFLINGVAPAVKAGYHHLNIDYNTSVFIIPVLITAYLVTLLSSVLFRLLPHHFKSLFTR